LNGYQNISNIAMELLVVNVSLTKSITGQYGSPLVIFNLYLLQDRIALAPPFPGLRRFKQGRNFNQWTGDDSKALMKVCHLAMPLPRSRAEPDLPFDLGLPEHN
jgi:hypothetical protein